MSLVELESQVMGPIDPEMATPLHEHLRLKGVDLCLSNSVTAIRGAGRPARGAAQHGPGHPLRPGHPRHRGPAGGQARGRSGPDHRPAQGHRRGRPHADLGPRYLRGRRRRGGPGPGRRLRRRDSPGRSGQSAGPDRGRSTPWAAMPSTSGPRAPRSARSSTWPWA